MARQNHIFITLVQSIIKPTLTSQQQHEYDFILSQFSDDPSSIYNVYGGSQISIPGPLRELNRAIDLINLSKHFNVYFALYIQTEQYLSTLTTHHQHKALLTFVNTLSNREQFIHIFCISMFVALSTGQAVVTPQSQTTVKIFVNIIELTTNYFINY